MSDTHIDRLHRMDDKFRANLENARQGYAHIFAYASHRTRDAKTMAEFILKTVTHDYIPDHILALAQQYYDEPQSDDGDEVPF